MYRALLLPLFNSLLSQEDFGIQDALQLRSKQWPSDVGLFLYIVLPGRGFRPATRRRVS